MDKRQYIITYLNRLSQEDEVLEQVAYSEQQALLISGIEEKDALNIECAVAHSVGGE